MRLVQKKDKREAIRLLPRYCGIEAAARKIMELKEKYAKRQSGFTRITPLSLRKGDNATLVKIELV